MRLAVPVNDRDHIRGNPQASVTLLEYGDYECPHCGAAHPVVERVLNHFGPRVRFCFRHFPLMQIHPNAEPASEAAEFAGGHRRFWAMHDGIYANQDKLGLPLLVALGENLGLDKEELVEAVAAQTYADRIREDFLGGVRSGVNGTPTFFINNRRHEGGYDYYGLVDAIEERLVGAAP
jgi:protein-disulfide isomerase